MADSHFPESSMHLRGDEQPSQELKEGRSQSSSQEAAAPRTEELTPVPGESAPLPPSALRRWLDAHPSLVERYFEWKTLPRQTRLFPQEPLRAGDLPRALIVVSGELALTQLFEGNPAPYKVLYGGDVWVNPNPPRAKQSQPPAAFRIESVATSHMLLLTEHGLRSLPRKEGEELARLLGDAAELQRARGTFFQALRSTVQFQHSSVRHLNALIDMADVRSFEGDTADPVVIPQGSPQEEHKGVFLVLDGQLGEWREPQGNESEPVLTRLLSPGSSFGDVVLHSSAPTPCSVRVYSGPARVAVLPQRYSEMLIKQSPQFANSVSPAPADTWQRLVETLATAPAAPELVLFRSDMPGVPMGTLIQGVAEATHQAHGDQILRVELSYGPRERSPEPPPEFRSGR